MAAVNNVSFGVPRGDSFGLVGPNGAGKSTTFNMILGKIKKDAGLLRLEGINSSMFSSPFGSLNVAAVFQTNSHYEKMSVGTHLKLFSFLLGLDLAAIHDLCRFLDFYQYRHRSVSNLSSGNMRKLNIIISLMCNPRYLFFDEATTGVDVSIRRRIKIIFDYLQKANNLTAINTTHFIKDIDIFCQEIGIMKRGSFVCVRRIENFKSDMGGYVILVKHNKGGQLDVQTIHTYLK